MAEPCAAVAVVVVAWKYTNDLERCLAGLAQQTVSGFEVVLADNGAGIAHVADRWEALDLTVIDMGGNVGVTRARNAAVAATDADLLLFLDDDAVPDTRWVQAYCELFANTDAWAARGKVVAKSPGLLNDLARAYDLGTVVRPAIINTEGNCAIRRSSYDLVAGFNEQMYGHEGAELSLRLVDAAGREDAVLYDPSAIIHHDYVDSLAGYVRKRYRHGLMLRHLDRRSAGRAAKRSRRKSRWTPTRIALGPVKVVGVGVELLGYLRSLVARSASAA
jgi:GT2 family glycosyltransferase